VKNAQCEVFEHSVQHSEADCTIEELISLPSTLSPSVTVHFASDRESESESEREERKKKRKKKKKKSEGVLIIIAIDRSISG
jgi:hypothetical protein